MNGLNGKRSIKPAILYSVIIGCLLVAVVITAVFLSRFINNYEPKKQNNNQITPDDAPKVIKVVFDNGSEIKPNSGEVLPGFKSNIKELTVSNASEVSLRYNIKWQNVYNDFKSDNLVYYIEINGEEKVSGALPKTDQVILDNIELNPGEIHYIKAYVEFINQNYEQNIDMNCTFSGVLIVDNV